MKSKHRTRLSDSSLYDEVCLDCGATDARGDDRLDRPCPAKKSYEGWAVVCSDGYVRAETSKPPKKLSKFAKRCKIVIE